MDQAQLLSFIGSLYDKLVGDVAERVIDQLNKSGALTTEVDTRIQSKIDALTGIDKEMIRNIVLGEMEDALSDLDGRIEEWMSDNFDINEYVDNLDIDDKVSDYLSNTLRDEVRDQIRNMDFTITVE